jgi:hypothetical protein
VPAATPKPKGLLRRQRPDGSLRYSMVDPAHHKELSLGHEARLAYSVWNAQRAQTISPPALLPVTWLLREFSIRKRPEDHRERNQLACELKDLCVFLCKIGDPSVTELSAQLCQEFRNSMARRPVAAETRIRRLRQVWNWANQERLIESECPWTAQNRHVAICVEVVDIVRQFLPPDVRDHLNSLDLNVVSQSSALKDQELRWLQQSIGRAALKASQQLRKDGRPDLVAVVTTCSLQTFLDAARTNLPRHTGSAKLLLGHSRIEKVASLRLTAHGTRGPSPGSEGFDSGIQGNPHPPDSSQGNAI